MSRLITTRFRNEIILALQAAGLPAAPPRPGAKLGGPEPGNTATITGFPAWSITCSGRTTSNFSTILHDARELSDRQQTDLHAAVVHRRGHSLDSDYVVMPFEVFVEILKRLHPELLATVSTAAPLVDVSPEAGVRREVERRSA